MKSILVLLFSLLAFSAQAKVQTYQGLIVSRKACVDNNNGVLSSEIKCKKLAVSNKTCKVRLNIESREVTRLDVEIPEVKAQREAWFAILSGEVDSPWFYSREFRLHNVKFSRTASAELKLDLDGRLKGLYVFTDHKFNEKSRSYKEYLCGSLKAVK